MTGHDLPQPKIKLRKEGKSWHWVHNGCTLYKANDPEGRKSFPYPNFEEARKGAAIHVDVHTRF